MPDAGESQSSRDGQIVTFYSFKGGTGRTMALANVAWILAANGMRVLVADWDLESPGLHRFFQPFLEEGVGEKPGIIDFVREHEWAAVAAGIDPSALEDRDEKVKKAAHDALANLISKHVKVQDYAIPVSWQFPDPGVLHYLSAGKQRNGAYQAALSTLDWDNFYDQLFGAQFFDALRAAMKKHYDYVLIDSRTGLSDVADICTVHLPDTVVDCFTLSTQGIEGAAEIARMIRELNERDIRILPVPMRIDQAEKERADAGQVYAARQFEGLPAGMSEEQRRAYWAEVAVPYRAFYAYEETLAVFGDIPGSPTSLLSSFERLVARITHGAVNTLPPMEESLRLRTRLRFARSRLSNTDEIVLDFSPEDQLWAEWIAAVLAGAEIAVRWVDELPTLTRDLEAAPRTIAIVTESYLARMSESPLPGRTDLAISVTDARMPHQLAEVPVVFLSGLSESQAADRLLSRLDGRRPGDAPITDVRYPGGSRQQVLSVPARNANFTGRDDDLAKLRGELRARGRAVVLPLTIQGLGGVGKTQVALEYAHRFKADYDVIWWMNCGQSQYVDASLADLGKRMREVFSASLPEEGSVAEVVKQVLELLSDSRTKQRWLLVYDNADDIEDVLPLLPSGHGHVLITSRNGEWKDKSRSLEVDVFDRAESIRHLRRRRPAMTEEEADQVAKVLGDLPLAVATAGAWLAETGVSVAEYLQQLEQQAPTALGSIADYPEPVAQAWDLSLDRLQGNSQAAAWLLGLCSVMAPDVSLDLIYNQAMATVLRRFDDAITEPVIIGRLVRQIDRLALIKLDNNARQIQVHRLVQAVVRKRMSKDLDAVQRDVHQVLVAARPDGDVDNPDTWLRYRLIWPHVTPSGAMLSSDESVRQLLIDRVRYLRQRGDLERARRRAAEIESAWKTMLADASKKAIAESLRKQLLRLQFNMANILRDLAEFRESRMVDEEVLGAQQELLSAEHPHTLMTRSSLAADLRADGEYAKALELDRDTYESWASGYGDEYPGTLTAAHNLAVSLRLTGDFQTALAQDRLTRERRSATLGPMHPRTLDSGAAVARDLLEAGRYAEVVDQMETVWAQCRERLGDDDRATLNARVLLGVALRCAGHPELAGSHLNEARTGLTRGFGSDSSDTLACRLSQALNLLATHRIREAKAAAKEVLAVYDKRLGSTHPHTLICKLNIATALCLEENYPLALSMAESAAEGLAARLGADDPYTLAAKVVQASALANQKRLAEAGEIEDQIAAERKRVLGPQHPDTLRSRANQLLTRHEQGVAGASAERKAIIEELTVLLGPEHADVGTALSGGRLLSAIDPQPF